MKRLALIFVAFLAVVAAPTAGAAISVGITSPADGSHSLSGVVPVRVSASADFGIYGVQLMVDGQPYGPVATTSVAPYEYEIGWDTSSVAPGTHTLAADAIDWSQLGGGTHMLSSPITVDVGPAYPTISLTNPTPWTFVRGTVNLAADVTSVGQTTVLYTVDGTAVATANAAPWQASWNSTTSPDGSKTVTATVSDGRGKQATANATVTVDNTPPAAYIVKPAANAFAVGTLAVSTLASDVYGISGVQYLIDGTPAGDPVRQPDLGAPYTYSATLDLSSLAQGTTHQLSVIAMDNAGNATTTAGVPFTIGAAPPTVTIAAPPSYSFARGVVPITAIVTGGVAPVTATLVVDGKATSQKAVAPYVFQWDTTKLAAGPHTIAALATDALGRSSSSDAVPVTVDNTPPSAVMYQPVPNARVNGPTTFQVHASDASGVQSVQFTVDGAPVGAPLTAPDAGQSYLYTTSVDTSVFAAGTHVVSATVTDNAGNIGKANSVTIKTGPIEYLPVLNYHEIAPPDGYSIYDQTPAEADQQLAYLKANGYHSVTLAQYQQWLAGVNIGVAKPVLITVDDGLKSEQAWDPILQKYGFKAVMFVITGYADQKTPGDADPNNMSWSDIKALAKNGRWEIAFHAGLYGHGDSYASGATIPLGFGTSMKLSTSCEYFYTCLGTITSGFGWRKTTRSETFKEYQQSVTAEVNNAIAELKKNVPTASFAAWAAPDNVAGQWTNQYNDPSGQVQSWFPGFMASKFPIVFTQTNPVTYGQASGTVGSLTGFNRHYRLEVHTDTTIAEFGAALADPAFAR